MLEFIKNVRLRNETMYLFGLYCLFFSLICILLTRITKTRVNNISAWDKPFKFAFSTFLYAWTMAWFCYYLTNFNVMFFDWSIIVLLGFEIIYIAIQAGRGQLSHYNLSTPTYALLYSLMALAASLATIYTAYTGLLFFTQPLHELPIYYLWSIRFGIIIFVIFSFEGFVMGSKLRHTVGGDDGTKGIPILNWSRNFGDLRVAHFIGMHALQLLPILSYYVFKNVGAVYIITLLYLLLAIFTLIQALKGNPLFKSK
jgi:hypothetical protein